MADDKARIEASLEGANQVASEARKIEGSLVGAGSSIEKKLGGALKGIGGALWDMTKGGLAAAGVFQTISLAKAVEDAKRLDLLTGQLALKAGTSSGALQSGYAKMEQRILTSSVAQAEFSKQLGAMTYDAVGAINAIDGLGQHALASGRELGDELPLGKALRDMGVQGQDTVEELDRVRNIAEKLGTAGGHLALQDSLGRLDSILQGVNTQTDQARGKLEALLGVVSKGQKTPERADQVKAATLNMLRSRALDIERATGRRVLDDNGELIDPTANLKDLRALSQRRHGGRQEEMRRALINTYGQEAGLAILRGGFDQVDELAQRPGGPSKTLADADKARQDPANQRRGKQLAKESFLRDTIGGALVGVDDALTAALGAKGATLAELAAGLWGGGKLLGAGKAALAGGGTAAKAGAGAGLAVPLLAGAAVAAPAVGVLAEIGEDRDTMGKKKRAEWARSIGAELAAKAQAQGGFSEDLMSKAGGNRDALVEMLKVLDSRKNQLSPDFAQQVAAALASELRRAPLIVRPQQDPNAPRPQ